MKRLDGKALAQKRRQALKEEIEERTANGRPAPGLAVILVGNDPASQVYVRNKENASKAAGIIPATYHLKEEVTQEALEKLVRRLNSDKSANGILVQMPLPKHLDAQRVIETISPDKDVDGLHPVNAGKLVAGIDGFVPCTPLGVMALLEEAGLEDLSGLNAIVIGRSLLVGKPVAQLLLDRNATVTMAHSRTKDLDKLVKQADIVVAAVGKSNLVKGDWIKPGAVVIDVGINRGADGKLCGDVDFEAAKDVASAITPVPGGCGPMTIEMLLENTWKAAQKQESKDIRLNYGLGDIVELKKEHACHQSKEWEIIRMGADIRVKCQGCGTSVLIPRQKFDKRLKRVVKKKEDQ